MSKVFATKLKKVVIITMFCFIAGAYFATIETFFRGLGDTSIGAIESSKKHSPLFSYLAQCLAGIIGGGFFASLDIFFLRKHFRHKSFGKAILVETGIFVLLFLIISLIVIFTYQAIYVSTNIFSDKALSNVFSYFQQIKFYLNFLNWMFVLILILLFLQVSDKFGEGTFTKFFFGKYHKPREEMRVFMFLDLKNSTGIAEKLGHSDYFRLLKDFFSDVTYPIIHSSGEIYQYVGDEITINWQLKTGLENSNCIKCFFEIKKIIDKKKEYYLKEYGIVPEFKAGIHFGLVTVGEVGIIKKEIVYSGDLLNTTARIMQECKNQNSDFLISKDLSDSLEQNHSFKLSHIGEIELRGKLNKIDLLSVSI